MTRDNYTRTNVIMLVVMVMVSCYLFAYGVYATCHWVPETRLSENFLKLHRGAVLFRDSTGGTIAWYAFYPASFAAYWLLNIDSRLNQGDSFGYWFCEDDYID